MVDRNKMENSLDILSCTVDSSFDEIKKSYRKLAKEFHPDTSKHENAVTVFKTVQEAYEYVEKHFDEFHKGEKTKKYRGLNIDEEEFYNVFEEFLYARETGNEDKFEVIRATYMKIFGKSMPRASLNVSIADAQSGSIKFSPFYDLSVDFRTLKEFGISEIDLPDGLHTIDSKFGNGTSMIMSLKDKPFRPDHIWMIDLEINFTGHRALFISDRSNSIEIRVKVPRKVWWSGGTMDIPISFLNNTYTIEVPKKAKHLERVYLEGCGVEDFEGKKHNIVVKIERAYVNSMF